MSAKFSDAEKVDLLIKKFFGKPSTSLDNKFYGEPSIDSRPGVFPSQIYSDAIPTTAPADNTFNSGNGKASMSNGSKSTSSANASITYYKKWQLVQVTPGNNQSFKGPTDDGGSITNILAGSIPFNYDPAGGYGVKLYRSDGSTEISFGTGEWVIDPDSGILTFYQYSDVSSYVNSTDKRPFLSFFRYSGNKGFTSISGLWTDSTNEIYYNNNSKTVVVNDTTRTANYALEVRGSRDVKIHNNLIAQDVTSLSDKSLKTNIRKLKYGMKEIRKINPVVFDWIQENKTKDNIGLIAQEVEKVIPELVRRNSNGYKAVKYEKLVPLLIESIKDQQKQIDELKKKLEEL